MAVADKRQIVSSNGAAAVRAVGGILRTTPGAAQAPTSRAAKIVVVDPVTGSIASVSGGALSTSGG